MAVAALFLELQLHLVKEDVHVVGLLEGPSFEVLLVLDLSVEFRVRVEKSSVPLVDLGLPVVDDGLALVESRRHVRLLERRGLVQVLMRGLRRGFRPLGGALLLTQVQMLQVPLLDARVRLQVVLGQGFVDLLGHFHGAVVETGFDEQKEQVQLRSLDVLRLELGNHLKNLHQSEILFSLVLHPEGGAPHVDPSDVNVGALDSANVGNVYFLSLENGFERLHLALGSVLLLQFALQIWS